MSRHITWRGVQIGGGSVYRLSDLEGWKSLPVMRVSNTDRQGRHGQYPGSMFAGGRVITATYNVSGDNLDALVEELRTGLAPDENPVEEELVISWDGTTRMVLARCERHQPTVDPLWAAGYTTGVIQWTATDPRQYSAMLHSSSTGLPAPSGSGVAFPLGFPLDFGPGLSGGQVIVANVGSAATWPLLVIAGPVTGPQILDMDGGNQLTFDDSFTVLAGQQLVIDTDLRTVLIGGTVSRRNELTTAQWFPLPKGGQPTRVGFRAASFDPAAMLTVQWRDAWM